MTPSNNATPETPSTETPLPEAVKAHKDRDGAVYEIPAGGETLFFRMAKEQDIERFLDESGKSVSRATKNLVTGLCLTPDALEKARKTSPVMFIKIGNSLLDVTGISETLDAKKR